MFAEGCHKLIILFFFLLCLGAYTKMIHAQLQLLPSEAISSILCLLHNGQNHLRFSSVFVPMMNALNEFSTVFTLNDDEQPIVTRCIGMFWGHPIWMQ